MPPTDSPALTPDEQAAIDKIRQDAANRTRPAEPDLDAGDGYEPCKLGDQLYIDPEHVAALNGSGEHTQVFFAGGSTALVQSPLAAVAAAIGWKLPK